MKRQVNSWFGHLEGWFIPWGFCNTWGRSVRFCFVDSNSLRSYRTLNNIALTLRHMFTSVDQLTSINIGGVCYRVVLERVSFSLDGVRFLFSLCDI